MVKISPSILNCNINNFAQAVKLIDDLNCDMLHLDIMDGVFVPNISFGSKEIKQLRGLTKLVFDVHLMVHNPFELIDEFCDAGADIITFHIENQDNPIKIIDKIKSRGKKAGISIKPKTDVDAIVDILPYLDLVLIMSVEPGLGGQAFINSSLDKIKKISKIAKEGTIIQVDGGINEHNFMDIIKNGANSLVMGTYFFNTGDKAKLVNSIKNAVI